MDASQRGRSPSQGHPSSARHTPAASPSPALRNSTSGTGYDPNNQSFGPNTNDYNVAATTASTQSFGQSFDFATSSQSLFPDQSFARDDSVPSLDVGGQPNNSAFPDFINFDEPLFATSGDNTSSYAALDPALLEPNLSPHQLPNNQLLNNMAAQTQSQTPPHLLAPTLQRHTSSPHGSPGMNQSQFSPPLQNRARNGSLDPSSAAYGQGGQVGQDWAGGIAFQGHRRTYSDAHSEISSAHQSPFLPNSDSFDQPHHSPHLGAQDPQLFQDVMGLGHVSLSEATPAYISPGHSPHISPSLLPTHGNVPFPSVDQFNLSQGMMPTLTSQYPPQNHILPSNGPDIYSHMGQNQGVGTPGQADAMTPPEISIQFAPPSRQASFEPQNVKAAADDSGLTPPEKSRGRAKSDPFSSRGSTPARDLLSPQAAGVGSRSPSPSNKSRRSSTSSVPNRDYILDLADPTRPTSTNSENSGSATKRTQKHPATFQCSLCPKRFTRAYNLRSHLRTHTDERPFVCSHCGKAFARQHDRKRHEGLHSGEKKFVCRGQLKDGNSWGCGRRFARADALGRHFRSEAGRVCIKPLMDEEALERNQPQTEPGSEMGIPIMPMPNQSLLAGQGQPNYGYNLQGATSNYPTGLGMQPQMPLRLPAALLQQYPTLGGIWDNLPTNVPDEIEGEISGRSSFDAGSTGDFEDEDRWHPSGAAFGWASDVGP